MRWFAEEKSSVTIRTTSGRVDKAKELKRSHATRFVPLTSVHTPAKDSHFAVFKFNDLQSHTM